jgi:hypothetical protein
MAMQTPATAGTQWWQRFSVWLDMAQAVYGFAAGLTIQGSNSGRGDFSHLSLPALGPTQPPVQWVPDLSARVKAARAWRCPLILV